MRRGRHCAVQGADRRRLASPARCAPPAHPAARADAAAAPDGAKACDWGSTTTSSTRRDPLLDPEVVHEVQVQDVPVHAAVAAAEPHPPPPPPPPVLDAMGCAFKYTVVKSWSRGFGGEVVPNEWEVGKKVLIDFGPRKVDITLGYGRVDADATHQRVRGRARRAATRIRASASTRAATLKPRDRRRRSSRACHSRRRRRRRRRPRRRRRRRRRPRRCRRRRRRRRRSRSTRRRSEGPRDDVVVVRVGRPPLERRAPHDADHPITSYEVRGAREQLAAVRLAGGGHRAEVGGLLARGTSSACGRRARRARPLSDPVSVAVGRAAAPDAPFGVPTRGAGEACTAVKLVLPELRSGHGNDSSYSVQMREGGGGGSQANWVPVLEGVTRGAATIEDLEPYTAYRSASSARTPGHLAARPAVGARDGGRPACCARRRRSAPTRRPPRLPSSGPRAPAAPSCAGRSSCARPRRVAAAAAPVGAPPWPRWRRAWQAATRRRCMCPCLRRRLRLRGALRRHARRRLRPRRRRRRRSARRSCRRRGAARRASASGCAAAGCPRTSPTLVRRPRARARRRPRAPRPRRGAGEGRGYAVATCFPATAARPRSSPPRRAAGDAAGERALPRRGEPRHRRRRPLPPLRRRRLAGDLRPASAAAAALPVALAIVASSSPSPASSAARAPGRRRRQARGAPRRAPVAQGARAVRQGGAYSIDDEDDSDEDLKSEVLGGGARVALEPYQVKDL